MGQARSPPIRRSLRCSFVGCSAIRLGGIRPLGTSLLIGTGPPAADDAVFGGAVWGLVVCCLFACCFRRASDGRRSFCLSSTFISCSLLFSAMVYKNCFLTVLRFHRICLFRRSHYNPHPGESHPIIIASCTYSFLLFSRTFLPRLCLTCAVFLHTRYGRVKAAYFSRNELTLNLDWVPPRPFYDMANVCFPIDSVDWRRITFIHRCSTSTTNQIR